MNKRRSLLMGALAAGGVGQARTAPAPAAAGASLLTVAGALARSNRGAIDPALDQLMVKHKANFSQARQFDAAMLARLPAVTITPTLEYDAKPHRLRGPLLSTVVEAAGVPAHASVMLGLRAIDGYTVGVSLADARGYGMIVATALDGTPMGLGGLGPCWAVYDADRLPAFKDKPLTERFGLCPWGLYFIEVKTA